MPSEGLLGGLMIKVSLVVLILVLVECPRRVEHLSVAPCTHWQVLILVLVECPRRAGKASVSLTSTKASLNPCFSGMPSEGDTVLQRILGIWVVLILVLVECPRRVRMILEEILLAYAGLNPCFSGMPSEGRE